MVERKKNLKNVKEVVEDFKEGVSCQNYEA